jgi:hypothetical protein
MNRRAQFDVAAGLIEEANAITAATMFGRFGAAAFAERARRELQATASQLERMGSYFPCDHGPGAPDQTKYRACRRNNSA